MRDAGHGDKRATNVSLTEKHGNLIMKSTQQMCPIYNVFLCLSVDGDMQ